MKKFIFFFIFFVSILNPCQKELEITYPGIDSKLVVNCLFTPDTIFKVRIGKLLSVNDSISSFIIENADCRITENGTFTEKLHYTENGFYVSTLLKPKTGNIYSIIVKHPDFETVTATDTIPQQISASNVYTIYNVLYDPLNESYFHTINIRFKDNVLLRNFYELKLTVRESYDTDTFITPLLLNKTNDLTLLNTGLIEYEPASIPFSDKLFNGQNYLLSTYYTLPFQSTDGNGTVTYHTHDLIVQFNSVSYQYFQYSRKMIMHLRNQNSDIFEGIGDPVQMYSNINNGYGIFASYVPYSDTLHHEKY